MNTLGLMLEVNMGGCVFSKHLQDNSFTVLIFQFP